MVGALSTSGLPAQRLEIEVTESIFVRDANLARAALEQIMALGCGVALDDFGTGYSSLGYIRNLRFSTIKIDRSFVQGAATTIPRAWRSSARWSPWPTASRCRPPPKASRPSANWQ